MALILKAERSATRRASVLPVRRFLALFLPVVTSVLVAALLFVWGHQSQHLAADGAMTISAVLGPPPEAIADYLEAAGLAVLGGTLLGIAALLWTLLSRRSKHGRNRRLMANERRLLGQLSFTETLLDSLPTPVFIKHVDGRYLDCNPTFEELVGFRRAEIVGRRVEDVFPAGQAAGARRHDEEIMASQQRQTYEADVVWRDGSVRRWLVFKSPFKGDDGGAGGLIGVILDITERKKAEEALQLAAEVFEHSAEGILVTDDQAMILSVNRGFTEITGYAEEEVLGLNPRILASGTHDRSFYANIFRTVAQAGFWKGEIVNRRKSGELYVIETTICAVRDSSNAIRRYTAIMRDITERKNNEQRLSYLAQHDFLTGLANRALLNDRIDVAILRSRRSRWKLAVILLDLNRFKAVNDRYGHAVGDVLLKEAANRLLGAIRQTDTVCRLGGDEFVVVLPDLRDRSDADKVCRKITEEITRPFDLNGIHVEVGVSIGIAIGPDDGDDRETLLQVADQAMYRKKQQRGEPQR